MKFTFRQLQVFLATAHTENISQAALRLNMSQSAASGALRELESSFDVRLFERTGKRLKLNDLGRRLWPQVEALLEQARDLEQHLSQHQDLGQLTIGATLTIGNYLAVNLLVQYMAEQPGARARLEVANTRTIIERVLQFELDLGMVEGEINHPELELIRWRSDELQAFCAPDHPLASAGALTDADLLTTPWIMREPGSGTRQTFERGMYDLWSELNIALELEHTEGIKRAVEAGLGISALSKVVLVDAFKRGTLVPLAIPHRDFKRDFHFVLHRQKYRSPGIERWLALCQSSVG